MSNQTLPINFVMVDHVNMFVRNLDESVAFYSKVFGTDGEIKEEGIRGEVRWCIIGIPRKFYFCLYELKGREFDPDAMHINHIGFYVDDFNETFKRLQYLGVPIDYHAQPINWHNRNGASRSIYIHDPNNYVIEFAEMLGGGLDG